MPRSVALRSLRSLHTVSVRNGLVQRGPKPLSLLSQPVPRVPSIASPSPLAAAALPSLRIRVPPQRSSPPLAVLSEIKPAATAVLSQGEERREFQAWVAANSDYIRASARRFRSMAICGIDPWGCIMKVRPRYV